MDGEKIIVWDSWRWTGGPQWLKHSTRIVVRRTRSTPHRRVWNVQIGHWHTPTLWRAEALAYCCGAIRALGGPDPYHDIDRAMTGTPT